MIAIFNSHHKLVTLLIAIGMMLCACSSAATLETPQGRLKVEDLTYQYRTGTVYANDPHRLVLTLTRADNEMFSVEDLNYIIHSGAYLMDSRGKKYSIPNSMQNAEILDSQTDTFRLEFSGEPGKDRGFILHWTDNSPIEIKREKHFMLDG